MAKRKKHQWQIDLEREQERLRNRPKLPKFNSRKPASISEYERIHRMLRLSSMSAMGIPAAVIVLGNPNYSSHQCPVERNLRRIIEGENGQG